MIVQETPKYWNDSFSFTAAAWQTRWPTWKRWSTNGRIGDRTAPGTGHVTLSPRRTYRTTIRWSSGERDGGRRSLRRWVRHRSAPRSMVDNDDHALTSHATHRLVYTHYYPIVYDRVLTKVLKGLKSIFPFLRPLKGVILDIFFNLRSLKRSLHVVKKILAPGKGSQISHLISQVAANAPFPQTSLLFVVYTGLKIQKSLS